MGRQEEQQIDSELSEQPPENSGFWNGRGWAQTEIKVDR